jgi:hypothetical protein
VQGPISIEPYTLDYHAAATVYYSLHVGKEKEFRVNKDLLNIMTRGEVYIVYYCNDIESNAEGWGSRDKILSVEFISSSMNLWLCPVTFMGLFGLIWIS